MSMISVAALRRSGYWSSSVVNSSTGHRWRGGRRARANVPGQGGGARSVGVPFCRGSVHRVRREGKGSERRLPGPSCAPGAGRAEGWSSGGGADQAFLNDGRQGDSAGGEEPAGGETAAGLGGDGLLGVQEPAVHWAGPVEPHRVVEAGGDESRPGPGQAEHPQDGFEDRVVADVGE